MMNEPDLGEQALDKIAEAAITSQLDTVDEIKVDIRTDPMKLMQGKVDSVAITGEGMVMQQDLRVTSVEVNTTAVAIDPLKAIIGQIQLTEKTDALAEIVLSETDINRALRSDYLLRKMKNLVVEVQGAPVTIQIETVNLRLPGDGKIEMDVTIRLQNPDEVKQFSAVGKPFLKENGYRIELEILSAEGKGLSLDFATALFERIIELLDLRNFDLAGMSLRLQDLSVQPGKLILKAVTSVEQLPSTM